MAENPYAPPSPTGPHEPSSSRSRHPIGVTIVAALFALPGVLVFGLLALSLPFEGTKSVEYLIRERGLGSCIAIGIIFAFGIAAGIGTFFRSSWGWFCGQLYVGLCAYGALRQWVAHHDRPNIIQVLIVLIHVIAAIFLCLGRPRSQFGLTARSAFAIELCALICSVVIYHTLTWLGVFLQRFE